MAVRTQTQKPACHAIDNDMACSRVDASTGVAVTQAKKAVEYRHRAARTINTASATRYFTMLAIMLECRVFPKLTWTRLLRQVIRNEPGSADQTGIASWS